MKLVSIIIPFKNPGKYFKPCLESISNQTHPGIEVLMINDNSNKQDIELARTIQKKDNRFSLHHSNGTGIIDALQTGLDLSTGDFISRMDADDIMAKDKIELMLNALLKTKHKSVCTGFVSYFASEKTIQDGYISYEKWLNQLSKKEANFTEIFRECTIPSPCWMTRKLDLESLGGFKALSYPEDYDLAFKMYYSNFRLVTVKKVIHFWRDHPERISRNSNIYNRENFILLKLQYLLNHELKNENLILWGAGKKGKILAKNLIKLNVDFTWITENPKKIGKTIYEIKLDDLKLLKKENFKIIICAISQIGFKKPKNSKLNRFISFY